MQQGEEEGKVVHEDTIKGLGHRRHRLYQLFLGALLAIIVINTVTDRTSAYLERRSVAVGSSLPSTVTSHVFTFDLLGSPTLGSIAFEYCSNSPIVELACTPPSGLDSSSASLTAQSGVIGFTVHPNTALSTNRIVLSRTPSVVSAGTLRYAFNGITNPDGSSPTVYVRMTTYSSTDGTGLFDDSGAVSFSIQNPLTVTVYVPPYLAMCSGVTVAVDCSATNGSTVDLGELSKTNPTTGTTQFAVATNSINGYVASIQGSTMTAGNRVIAALPAPTTSQVGVSQFGINLRANSSPSVGQNVTGAGTGVVATSYNTPNLFGFNDGDTLATSSLPTDWNRYTISYMVNIGSSQQAGRYATTMTVIATTTF